MSLPAEIVDLDDYTENIIMMIYGDSGAGKTVLAGSDDKVLFIATEKGTVSAKRFGSAAKVWKCFNDWDKFEDAYEWLSTGDNAAQFNWIVIDTVTAMHKMILNDIVRSRAESTGAKNKNLDKVQLEEYGEQQMRFQRYVGLLNDLPCNILYLAHPKQVEDADGNEFLLPDIHGKKYQLAAWMCAEVHAYGYMSVEKAISAKTKKEITVRRIQWESTPTIRAKDRYDAFGPKTTNKSLKQLRTMIEESATVDDSTPAKAPAKA